MITNSSLKELTERVRNKFRAYIPGSDAFVFPNNLWISATVIGGLLWELFGFARKIPDLVMLDTAEGEMLERYGNMYGVSKDYGYLAEGEVTINGEIGTVIPVNTPFKSATGETFTSTKETFVSDGVVTVPLIADEIGKASNVQPLETMQISVGIAGLDDESIKTTESGISGGGDEEPDEVYRQRIYDKLRNVSFDDQNRVRRFGAIRDFEAWAKEVPGVTRAWSFMHNGYVTTGFLMDNKYLAEKGIPMQVDVDAVQAYLTDECRKPLCCRVHTLLLIPKKMVINLGCILPYTIETKELIEEQLNQWLYENSAPNTVFTEKQIEKVICDLEGVQVDVSGGSWKTEYNEIFTEIEFLYG